MAKLFVAYYYASTGRNGWGNSVLDNTAPPTSEAEVKALQAAIARAEQLQTVVITNYIVMP